MKWVLVAVIAVAGAGGDILQARGMRRHGEIRRFGLPAMRRVFVTILREPLMIAAVCAYAAAFFAFLRLVSVAPLSFAVPATAVSYVFDTVLAKYLLRERVQWRRWLGACLVAAGVALLSL